MIVALDLLEQAICHDPNYGSALALAASCHLNLHVGGWTDDPEESRRGRARLGVTRGLLAGAAHPVRLRLIS